jgi:ankyrin repeat protein
MIITMVIRFSAAYDARQSVKVWMFVLVGFFMPVMYGGCSTPLLNVAANGDIRTARELVQQGHNVNQTFPMVGTTPLMLAASHGHAEIVQMLIEAGADVNARDFTGWTALHSAAYKGDPKIVSSLLEHGAVARTDRWFLQSPAGMAEALGHSELLPLLRPTDSQQGSALRSPPVQTHGQIESR